MTSQADEIQMLAFKLSVYTRSLKYKIFIILHLYLKATQEDALGDTVVLHDPDMINKKTHFHIAKIVQR